MQEAAVTFILITTITIKKTPDGVNRRVFFLCFEPVKVNAALFVKFDALGHQQSPLCRSAAECIIFGYAPELVDNTVAGDMFRIWVSVQNVSDRAGKIWIT